MQKKRQHSFFFKYLFVYLSGVKSIKDALYINLPVFFMQLPNLRLCDCGEFSSEFKGTIVRSMTNISGCESAFSALMKELIESQMP